MHPRSHFIAAALVAGAALFAPMASAQTVLRVGEGNSANLDPAIAASVPDSVLFYNVYDTLVFPGVDQGTNEMRPHLAEKVDVNAAGTVYTIKLRPNVKFHTGNTMTAEDVVFSLERFLALKRGNSFLFDGWVSSVVAKDPLTVEVTLKKPYSTFFSALSRLGILDKKAVMANKKEGTYGEYGDYGVAWLNTNSAGTGAYRPVAHKQTEGTELHKFKDYFKPINAKAPDVVRLWYHQADPTVVTLFQRGEMDMGRSFIASETKETLLGIKGVTLEEEPGVALFFIKLNNKRAPFDDVHCRRALAFAVDYDSLVQIEKVNDKITGAKLARGPLLSGMSGYSESQPLMKRDMAKAKAELAKCKHKPGSMKIQISYIENSPKGEPIGLLLQLNWQELGFQSELQRMPWAMYTQLTSKPETTPMVGMVYTFARVPDPDAYLYNIYHSSRHGQFSAAEHFADAEVDAMLDKGRSMPIGPERTALYEQLVKRIVDLQPSIWGYENINLYPKRDSVKVPLLENPKLQTGLSGGNYVFRMMEMQAAK